MDSISQCVCPLVTHGKRQTVVTTPVRLLACGSYCPSFFLTCFEVIRALAEDTRNDKWNLYLLNITNYKRRVYINKNTALEIKSHTKTVSVKETHKTEKAITVPHNLSYTKTTN